MHSSLTSRPDLAAHYAWCRGVCQQSRSSFFSSFHLLDPPRRRAMYALYAFARITDDLGDNGSPREVRQSQLNAWQTQLALALHTHAPVASDAGSSSIELLPPEHAMLWPALSHTVDTFSIPSELLFEVIQGVRLDLDPSPPATWDELKHYCYHVASAVGLACAAIWRRGPEIPTQSAVDCGIAFQLTNILRDLAEDARGGRIYIPMAEMKRFGVDPERWLAGQPDGQWIAMVDYVAREAERLYLSGWPTISALTPRSQRMFSLMWRSYRRLLTEVLKRKQSLWTQPKVRLSAATKVNLLTQHLIPQIFRRLPAP